VTPPSSGTPPASPEFTGVWRDDDRARAAYSEGAGIYRILPRAVAVPSTTKALVDLVRWARDTKTPLVPRGAGSGMPGHNVGEGVIVDLSALDGAPLTIDPDHYQARAGVAIALDDLNAAAARHGLRMPVNPSSSRWATVGGVVSTNAAGPRTVRYGPVRRWVDGLTLVTADAEVVELARGVPLESCALLQRFREEVEPTLRLARWRVASTFPKTRKNTAGYGVGTYLASGDLLDLVIGAEGTLGIVTEVTWRLEPIPVARAAVRAAVRDVRRLAHCVPALLELEPSSVEFLDGSFLRFVGDALASLPRAEAVTKAGALVLVEFEGRELADQVERAVGILKPESVEVLAASTPLEIESLWAIRHAASRRLAALGERARSLQVIEDGAVPLDRLGDYVTALHGVAERHEIPIVLFGHAGDGHVHANLLPDLDRSDWEDRVRAVFAEVSQLVATLGGTPSGEHGDGRLRAGLLEKTFGWEMVQLFRQIKRTFDPLGIMNPGVKLDGPADPLGSLKVGSKRAPIPPEIERGLRWVESQGGYAGSRLTLADDPGPEPAA
jgi:FAD/FMN-containing dehydrogenase